MSEHVPTSDTSLSNDSDINDPNKYNEYYIINYEFDESDTDLEYDIVKRCEEISNAVKQDNVPLLRRLLKEFEPKELIRDTVRDILHFSIRRNKKDIFDFLLSVNNININLKNNSLETPLMVAVRQKKTYYINRLLQCKALMNWCHMMKHYKLNKLDDIEKCLSFIEQGADINAIHPTKLIVNAQVSYGPTSLQIACSSGDFNHICMLLYLGADPTIRSSEANNLPFTEVSKYSETWIQEVIFNYTFSGKEKLPVNFNMFLGAIDNPYLFKKIMKNTSRVILNKPWSRFRDNLTFLQKISPELCEIFLNKFPYVVKYLAAPIKHKKKFAHIFENESFLEILDCIQQYTDVFYCKSLENYVIMWQRKLPQNKFHQLVYYFLSFGGILRFYVLHFIYEKEGFSNFFEDLLFMNNDLSLFSFEDTKCPLLYLICHFDSRSIDVLPSHHSRHEKMCEKHCFDNYFNCQKDSVSSLLELARNSARKHLIKHYNIKSSSQFMSVINKLGLANAHKNILILKTQIYN